MDIVQLQLKIKDFCYEIHDDDGNNKRIYTESSDKRFFEKSRKIWNKIAKLMFIDNALDFVKTNDMMRNILEQIYLKTQILSKALVIKMKL